MTQEKNIKLIAKNAQGSVFVSHQALKDALDIFIKKTIQSKKMPFSYKGIEFINFNHEINFQINVFLVPKNLNFDVTLNRSLQTAILSYIGNVFVIEPITINVICSLENNA